MSGSFDDSGKLVIGSGKQVFAAGRKGSGKSIYLLLLFKSYPYDKIVVDSAGDDGPWGEGVITLEGTFEDIPTSWPKTWWRDGKPVTVRYVPNPRSPTLAQDIDAVVSLALARGKQVGHCGLLIHEVGLVAPVHKTQPAMREALMAGRHHGLTLLCGGPRPIDIDPLVMAQADVILVFDVPNPYDRRRIYETIGFDKATFEAAWKALLWHEYLRYDAREPPAPPGGEDRRLVAFVPLPKNLVDAVERWARPGRPQQS
jgi:hypothetical protein